MLNKVQIAMSTSSDIALPSKAVWVSPVKMSSKKTDYNKKYFHCDHLGDKKCPVRVWVSLDVSSDMITG